MLWDAALLPHWSFTDRVCLSRDRKLRATDHASACRARQMYQLSSTSGVVAQCKYIWNCQIRLSTVTMPPQFKAPAPAQPPHCYPSRHQPSPNGSSQAAHHDRRCCCAMAAPWPRPGPSPANTAAAAGRTAPSGSHEPLHCVTLGQCCQLRCPPCHASAAAARPLVTPSSRQRASCCRAMPPHTAESGWPRLAAAAQSVNAAQNSERHAAGKHQLRRARHVHVAV